MGVINNGTEKFRPYARLISILGDQLISNKWVGVIELVKNCYDADAEDVTVRFLDIDKTGKPRVIEIEDDGDGMTLQTIQDIWMKPATPNKLNKKNSASRFTKKGRLMQGDKGVGRFAVYKLGDTIEIFTKQNSTNEIKLNLNFAEYAQTDETGQEVANTNNKFLDEIPNSWAEHDTPERILNTKNQGTIIRITDLRNQWKKEDLEKLEKAFFRMVPPSMPDRNIKKKKDEVTKKEFDVSLEWDTYKQSSSILPFEDIMEMAPFSFEGSIDDLSVLEYTYKHDGKIEKEVIDLFQDVEHSISSLKLFREQFYTKSPQDKTWVFNRKPIIGPFSFYFYSFDLKNKMGLTAEQISFIKDNSVYLYRDKTRVYPYGERGIDWLMLSQGRAEDRAGYYFSYNDLIGFIFIEQKNNPLLRDAADREGLMNINGAYDDFVALIQAALKVMKDKRDRDIFKDALKKQKPFSNANTIFIKAFDDLRDSLEKYDDKPLLDKSRKLLKATNDLVEIYKTELTISQELAGVGMAVEKSTHDTFVLLRQLKTNALEFTQKFRRNKLSAEEFEQFLSDLNDNLEFLTSELQILQPLLRIARKVTKDVSVNETANRVERYFGREFRGKIDFSIDCKSDVIVKTNTGLILQVLINLTDNAIYWLNQRNPNQKKIVLKIDGDENRIIFADNGTGINHENLDIIFLEFFSMKADGRGLGLYIVKELLERIGAEISVITEDKLKILPGANFLIQFTK
jgi:signal transduction histidine kinase